MQKEIKSKAGAQEFKDKTVVLEEKITSVESRSLKSKQALKQLEVGSSKA